VILPSLELSDAYSSLRAQVPPGVGRGLNVTIVFNNSALAYAPHTHTLTHSHTHTHTGLTSQTHTLTHSHTHTLTHSHTHTHTGLSVTIVFNNSALAYDKIPALQSFCTGTL